MIEKGANVRISPAQVVNSRYCWVGANGLMTATIKLDRFLLFLLALLALAGCAPPTPQAAALPLATDRPTFLFFFTDG